MVFKRKEEEMQGWGRAGVSDGKRKLGCVMFVYQFHRRVNIMCHKLVCTDIKKKQDQGMGR